MTKDHHDTWIEALTEIASDVERLHQGREREVRKLAEAFFTESVEICRTIRESYQMEIGADEEGFMKVLIQCNEDMGAAIASFERGSASQKDELCYFMYRFISLLSQRINFESLHKAD